MNLKLDQNLIGTTYLNKYKIIRLLGKGGMNSTVYLAENTHYNQNSNSFDKFKYVALKFIKRGSDISNDNWIKILDEKVTIGRLTDNPYIVELELCFPSSTSSDAIVFSMEYVNGPSLKQLIRQKGCLSIVEALSIFKKIVHGVYYMHNRERAIIHRDLKPENILLSDDLLDVKISDFGVSSVVQNIDQTNRLILSNEIDVFGTIPYMSPDVIDYDKKNPKISKQLDFHALGIILYEMLVGTKPFEIENENDPVVITYFQKYDVTPLSKINPSFNNNIMNLFLKLTASKPHEYMYRYKDCLEILNDVEKIEKLINQKALEQNLIVDESKINYQLVTLFKTNHNKTISQKMIAIKYFWFIVGSLFVFIILLIVSLIIKL